MEVTMSKFSKKSIILLVISGLALVFGIVLLIIGLTRPKDDWENQRKQELSTRKVESELDKIAKNLNFEIHRYDQDLFTLDQKNLAEGVRQLSQRYPSFLIEPGVWSNPQMMQGLKAYLNDKYMKEIFREVNKQLGDMSDVYEQLKGGLVHYLYYFPEAQVPEFYTILEGIDNSGAAPRYCYSVGDTIVLMPDWYLGSNNKLYEFYRVEKYLRAKCDKKYMAIDCFRELIAPRHLPHRTAITLLDCMIDAGKTLYFTEMMFPDRPAGDIIGYDQKQMDWAKANQANVWNYMIEKEMVFSKDERVALHMLGVAPESQPFHGSPGRLGAYIGWMIVINYMQNNPKITLPELMAEKDSRKILDKSGYKPLK